MEEEANKMHMEEKKTISLWCRRRNLTDDDMELFSVFATSVFFIILMSHCFIIGSPALHENRLNVFGLNVTLVIDERGFDLLTTLVIFLLVGVFAFLFRQEMS